MTNEMTIAKLKEVVSSSNIELTKAEAIAANYAPIMSEVQAQMAIVAGLKKGNKDHVEKAKRVRIDLGKIASKAAAQKKVDKDDLLLQTRFIDALYNTVEGAARITQGEAKEIEEYFERLEAERKAKLREDRWFLLSEFTQFEPMGLAEMEQPVFEKLLSGAKFAHEAKLEAERKAEEARIEAARLEAERIEQQRLENERLKAEAAEKEKELQAERDRVRAERAAAEAAAEIERKKAAEELAAQQEAARKEREAAEKERQRLAAELQAKKDAEAKAERERLAEIERKRKEAEKLAKAPVKQKLTVWVDGFFIPEKNIDHALATEINDKFEAFKKWAKTQIELL